MALVTDQVGYWSSRSWSRSAACDRTGCVARATDDPHGGEAVDGPRRGEADDSGDGSTSIGDDDIVTVACKVDPSTEVSPEFCHRYVHTRSVQHDCKRDVHVCVGASPRLRVVFGDVEKDRAVRLSVEFPSVAYREGPEKVADLARAIEAIGYDDLAVFDHVIMGYPTDTRSAPIYPPQMPILEALVTLGFAAAVTKRVTLSTEVLVLPQRQAVLVAKQVSTLDTLSSGRMRLGVGVGWQAAEYESLGEDFSHRGRVMDEAITLLRACWREERIDESGARFRAESIAMEPKPPSGGNLPIWIGGASEAAYRRVGELGDGWMGMLSGTDEEARAAIVSMRGHAERVGRDPAAIGLQTMLAPPPRDPDGKTFYADHARVVQRAEHCAALGFGWIALNATAIFQAGARSVDAVADQLNEFHGRLRAALG